MKMTSQTAVHLQWNDGLWVMRGVPEQPLLFGPIFTSIMSNSAFLMGPTVVYSSSYIVFRIHISTQDLMNILLVFDAK